MSEDRQQAFLKKLEEKKRAKLAAQKGQDGDDPAEVTPVDEGSSQSSAPPEAEPPLIDLEEMIDESQVEMVPPPSPAAGDPAVESYLAQDNAYEETPAVVREVNPARPEPTGPSEVQSPEEVDKHKAFLEKLAAKKKKAAGASAEHEAPVEAESSPAQVESAPAEPVEASRAPVESAPPAVESAPAQAEPAPAPDSGTAEEPPSTDKHKDFLARIGQAKEARKGAPPPPPQSEAEGEERGREEREREERERAEREQAEREEAERREAEARAAAAAAAAAAKEAEEREAAAREALDVSEEVISALVTGEDAVNRLHEVIEDASRCLYCFDAPCVTACPVSLDMPEINRRVAANALESAALLMAEQNPIAGLCGKVCPADLLCEASCVLNLKSVVPIKLHRIEGYLGDLALTNTALKTASLFPSKPAAKPARVAVVGAGPAGMSCAVELRRLGHFVTVFEARARPGGLATHAIPSLKLPTAVASWESQVIASVGVEMRYGVELDDIEAIKKMATEYDAIFLGVGLGRQSVIGIEGERKNEVVDGLELILAHRAGNDLPIELAGKVVIVIGGGNISMFSAILAAEMGARQAVVVFRGKEDDMSAEPDVVRIAREHGAMFIFEHEPVALHRGEPGKLECRPIKKDKKGDKNGRNLFLPSQVVIKAVGHSVDSIWSQAFDGVESKDGVIVVDPETGQTGNAKVYAGGDCTEGGGRVVYAIREGLRSAKAMDRYLNGIGG